MHSLRPNRNSLDFTSFVHSLTKDEMVHILDDYFLAITFLVSLGLQSACLAFAFLAQSDKLTDLAGSLNFFLIAILTLCAGGAYSARSIVASVFVMIWAVRLGGFLFYRVLKTGKDGRFDDMRGKLVSLAGFFTFQLLWAWVVSLPLTLVNSPKISDRSLGGGSVKFGTASDIVGVILWSIGFVLEVVGDQQKFSWKMGKPPKGEINHHGVWGWTRHPNFAGEIILWWGIYALCIAPASHHATSSAARHAQYASIVGPVFITLLLMFVSGLPLAEKPTAKRYYLLSHGPKAVDGRDPWEEYKAYLHKTSILFPLPPSLYRPLPAFIKKTILLDLPMYQFHEYGEGPEAVEEETRRLREAEQEDA